MIEGFVVIETFSKFWEWPLALRCVWEEKLAFFDKLDFFLFLCFDCLCDVLINTTLVESITNLQAFFNWYFSREVSLMSIRICLWINFCDWDGVVSAARRPAWAKFQSWNSFLLFASCRVKRYIIVVSRLLKLVLRSENLREGILKNATSLSFLFLSSLISLHVFQGGRVMVVIFIEVLW